VKIVNQGSGGCDSKYSDGLLGCLGQGTDAAHEWCEDSFCLARGRCGADQDIAAGHYRGKGLALDFAQRVKAAEESLAYFSEFSHNFAIRNHSLDPIKPMNSSKGFSQSAKRSRASIAERTN
jgi:hypothetical protein